MQEVNFDEVLDKILTQDPRFQRDAYLFLREALEFTQKLINKERGNVRQPVTGRELLDGIRQYALQQFGPMTITVFEEWGLRTSKDFGDIVFNMVEGGLLAKTETDTREDFKDGYNFTDAFAKPYWPEHRLNPPTKPVTK